MNPLPLISQVQNYPTTRYMGSKQAILPYLWQAVTDFEFESVLDLFSGSGVVSYMFKAYGKQVYSNDFMKMNGTLTRAMVENSNHRLSPADVNGLLEPSPQSDGFVSKTFKGLYFPDEENRIIDSIRANIRKLRNRHQRAIAISALMRAVLKKRPRGIFTYTGYRYDDGRRDLKLSFQEQFRFAVNAINKAVFDNHMQNESRCGSALNVPETWQPDLVYMDPPYYSPYSDNDYVRRYHFMEGLACDWRGVEIQQHTKTKKIKSYPSPFSSRSGAYDAFEKLFKKFRDSIILISYSSNSLPTQDEILTLLSRYKKDVQVISVDYRYSFANQGHKKAANKNKVQEYIFVGS